MKCDTTLRLLGILVGIAAVGTGPGSAVAETVGFEDLTPTTAYSGGGHYWNGSDESGGFTSSSLQFNNNYDTKWTSWDGWSYSNTTDTTTEGYPNQYSAFAGGGTGGSATYGVAFIGFTELPEITLPAGYYVSSAMITNTTYAALSIRDGYLSAKKFGGDSGDDPDWFLLTIVGKNSSGQSTGSEEFYLADYRFANNTLDYFVNDWTEVDLSSLKGANTLEFSLTSSDNHPTWGMNTPGYFAIDNIMLEQVPEPSTVVMLLSAAVALLLVRRRRR